ncbi:MAG: hypothetical protein ACRCYU_06450, partial [Nocardioides sp.]
QARALNPAADGLAMSAGEAGWIGDAASAFRDRSGMSAAAMALVAQEMRATAPPLERVAEKLESSRRQVAAIINWLISSAGRAEQQLAQSSDGTNAAVAQQRYQAEIERLGRQALTMGMVVVKGLDEVLRQVATDFRTGTYLSPSGLAASTQLTAFGDHYVHGLARGDLSVLAGPGDITLGAASGAFLVPPEYSRQLGRLGSAGAMSFALRTAPGSAIRNTMMVASDRPVFESPLLQVPWTVGVNYASSYGSNWAAGQILGPRGRNDIAGLLAINNSLVSLSLQGRATLWANGLYAKPELIDDRGLPVYLTNKSYNANLWYDIAAINAPPTLLLAGEAALARRPAISAAIQEGNLVEAAALRAAAAQDFVRTAGVEAAIGASATVLADGVIQSPPEPGIQRSVYDAVGGFFLGVNDHVIQPVWRSDPVVVLTGIGGIAATTAGELVLGSNGYAPGEGIRFASPAAEARMSADWQRVQAASQRIGRDLGAIGVRFAEAQLHFHGW